MSSYNMTAEEVYQLDMAKDLMKILWAELMAEVSTKNHPIFSTLLREHGDICEMMFHAGIIALLRAQINASLPERTKGTVS